MAHSVPRKMRRVAVYLGVKFDLHSEMNDARIKTLTCRLRSLAQSEPLQQVEIPRVGADAVKVGVDRDPRD